MAEGAKVAACGRNRDGLESSAQCHVVGDITEKGVCEQVVSSSVEQLGGIAQVRVSYHKLCPVVSNSSEVWLEFVSVITLAIKAILDFREEGLFCLFVVAGC